jgi:hypothetical protein
MFEKAVIVYHSVDFISETIDMFGFISKFKKDVTAGFNSIHERLITLEAKVNALFEHANATATATVSQVKAEATTVATKVEAAPAAVATIPAETAAAVEAVPAEVVAEVKANV